MVQNDVEVIFIQS